MAPDTCVRAASGRGVAAPRKRRTEDRETAVVGPGLTRSTAIAGGAIGGAAGLGGGDAWHVLVGLILGVLGALVAVADVRERRIPDRLLTAGAAAAVVVVIAVELVDGRRPAFDMLLGAAIASLPLLVVHLVTPTGLGFGDVKLAAVAGGLLGIVAVGSGGLAVAAACVLALVGAAVRMWPRQSIPFGACLAVSAVASLALVGWM